VSAQRKAVATGDDMLVGAAKEVSAGAADHSRSRIVGAVERPWISRPVLLGHVPSMSEIDLAALLRRP
jgi:hypothetical protein